MEVLTTTSMMNPQCKYGEDVMARITYHMMNPGGLETMSNDLIAGLNSLIAQACESTHPPKKRKKKKTEEAGVEIIEAPDVVEGHEEEKEEKEQDVDKSKYPCLSVADIVDLTLVGNTAMHHIFLKLDPEFVGLAPFPPVIHRGLDIKARDLELISILPRTCTFYRTKPDLSALTMWAFLSRKSLTSMMRCNSSSISEPTASLYWATTRR